MPPRFPVLPEPKRQLGKSSRQQEEFFSRYAAAHMIGSIPTRRGTPRIMKTDTLFLWRLLITFFKLFCNILLDLLESGRFKTIL